MPKPPPGPAKPKPPQPDVAETIRLPPLEEQEAEASDETVEVTNPLAKMPAAPQPVSATRVDKVSSRDDLRAAVTTDPSVDMTIPLPRILEPTPAPAPKPIAAETKVEGLPNRSSREQPAVQPEGAGPEASKDELNQSKPVDVARRATVLKINPETIQSWMDDGSGEHKAPPPGNGPRPLIEDLREELEAESKKRDDRVSSEPGKPAPLPLRASSERNPRQNVAEMSTAPKVVLRERSSFRDRAKRMSNTLSMLLKQEAARRRRGFFYGVLTVAFIAGIGYFGYVYLWPLLKPVLPMLLKR